MAKLASLYALLSAPVHADNAEKCPEANRNDVSTTKSSLLLYDLVNKHVKETWNTLESSRWRENLHHYIEEMEDLTRRKPGYKATMNTYAPCRPIMENLQCVRNVLNNFTEQHKTVFFPQGQLVYQPVTHFGYGFRRADSESTFHSQGYPSGNEHRTFNHLQSWAFLSFRHRKMTVSNSPKAENDIFISSVTQI